MRPAGEPCRFALRCCTACFGSWSWLANPAGSLCVVVQPRPRAVLLVVDLFGEVLLFADLFDDVELGFEPIHAFFLVDEDAFEQFT